MKTQKNLIRPGCRNTKLVQGSNKTAYLVKNPTRCLVELDRYIGELHHSFCGNQYDYIIPYYSSNLTKRFKVKYTVKFIAQLVMPSLLAAGIFILPALLHNHLELDLLIPCAVFLFLVASSLLPKVINMLSSKWKQDKRESCYGPVQWRILSLDEVEQLKEKITERFQAIFTVCVKDRKKWLHYRDRIHAIQRKQTLYSGQSMYDLNMGDILYYRALSVVLPLYKRTLAGLAVLLYAYTLTSLLINGMHSLPVDSLKNALDCLLLAVFLSCFLCFFQLFLSGQFLHNFKTQLAFFTQSSQQVKERIASLNNQHQV
jgi:hypothetical protein